jgi:MFS family permease
LVGVSLFELGNMAATLLILRATDVLTPERGLDGAATIAIALYVTYNLAATVASAPAGRVADRMGARRVFATGVALFAVAYALFALPDPSLVSMAVAFITAGVAIGAVETGENAAVARLAPAHQRGSAFGLLAGIQSLGDFTASAVIGVIWTIAGPSVAFGMAVAAMLASLLSLLGRSEPAADASQAG